MPVELQPVRDEKGIVPFCAQEGEKLIPIDLAAMCAANEDLMTVSSSHCFFVISTAS